MNGTGKDIMVRMQWGDPAPANQTSLEYAREILLVLGLMWGMSSRGERASVKVYITRVAKEKHTLVIIQDNLRDKIDQW